MLKVQFLFLLIVILYKYFLSFQTFFRHLLVNIRSASKFLQVFFLLHLLLGQFRFHDVLEYGLLHLCEYQILHLKIFFPLQSTLNASLDMIIPKGFPISLYGFQVLLSKVQNHMDFFFLDLHLLLLLQFGRLIFYQIKLDICLIQKYQNIFLCLFRKHNHFLIFF